MTLWPDSGMCLHDKGNVLCVVCPQAEPSRLPNSPEPCIDDSTLPLSLLDEGNQVLQQKMHQS